MRSDRWMGRGLAVAVMAVCGLLVPTAASAHLAQPLISSVAFSGTPGDYTLAIAGKFLGGPAVTLPFSGEVGNFRLQDNAQLGDPGAGEWGHTGDIHGVTLESWTATAISVSGVGLQPGDAVVLAVTNLGSGRSAVWGGTVPGVASSPVITTVALSSLGTLPSLRIAVKGHGFGPAPRSLPFIGDLDQFAFGDLSVTCGGGPFTAGGSYFGVKPADPVTMRFVTWTDTKIVVAGFRGAYGQGCNRVHTADVVAVSVWNSASTSVAGLQTAHRGWIFYPGISH